MVSSLADEFSPAAVAQPGWTSSSWGSQATSRPRIVARPHDGGVLRRRDQWCPIALSVTITETLLSFVVMAAAAIGGMPVLAAVALIWGAIQGGSASLNWRYRRVSELRPTIRRARVLGVGLLAVFAFSDLPQLPAVIGFVSLVGMSLALRRLGSALTRRFRTTTRVVVAGRGSHLRHAVAHHEAHGAEVLPFDVSTSTWGLESDRDEVATLNSAEALTRGVLHRAPDRVIVLPGALTAEQTQELGWAIEHYDIDLLVETSLPSVASQRLEVVSSDRTTALRVTPSQSRTADKLVRAVDAALSGLLLLVLSPLMLVIAGLIKRDSSGPALFVQKRVGRDGEIFPMLKFRTMHVNAEEMLEALKADNEVEGGVLFKMKHDPRITRVGRVLRSTSLDELPQLINVLVGHMSLIGPRPALQQEVDNYDRRTRRRLAVRPGLTGLWQVSGRSNLSWEDSVRLDIDYVDNWTPRREVSIAVRTVKVVATREGAY